MTIRERLAIVLAVSMVAIVPALAQMPPSSTNAQNSATAQAGKAAHKAQALVDQLQGDLNKIRARARDRVRATPEGVAAVAAKKRAEMAVDSARKTALAPVRNTDDYKNLLKDREKAQAAMSQANASDAQPADADAHNAADTFVKDSFALKDMEQAALKDDQAYIDAVKQVGDADAKLNDLDAQADLTLKDDQEYQTTQRQLEQAKVALASARQQLAQAAQQDRQARAAAAKARQNTSTGGGGGGGRGY